MARAKRARPFRRLQWQLTRSYLLVTVSAVVLIEVLGAALIWYLVFVSALFPRSVAEEAAKMTPRIAGYLTTSPADTKALSAWLETLRVGVENEKQRPENGFSFSIDTMSRQSVALAVTDIRGDVIAVAPAGILRAGAPLSERLNRPEQVILARALHGKNAAPELAQRGPKGRIVAAAPVRDKSGRVIGAFFVHLVTPFNLRRFAGKTMDVIIPSAVLVALFAGIAGTCFGFFTARRLTRRLSALSQAADAWSRGEFAATVPDSGPDELGQLAERLNRMARQLQGLFALREEVATLEERNRLARDLHDAVKQQVFATSMQVGAARALLDRDPPAAGARLVEAEQLARHAQQELTAILRELRPAAAPGGGQNGTGDALSGPLRDYVTEWSRRSGIPARLEVGDLPAVPPFVQQALFRIAQEALTNVARHSGATTVRIELGGADGRMLAVEDDGRGFDPQKQGPGIGLHSMRERAEALPGGRFRVESRRGKGTRIEVRCEGVGTNGSG